jgi:hypothetical protein
MIHVVFQEADIETLKQAIALDDSLNGEIFQIKDDFAVGPLTALDTDEGWEARRNWWMERLESSPYPISVGDKIDDRETVRQIKAYLDENPSEELWIWMAQNGHDVCSYFWLIPQLKEYQGRVVILYFNNLPFINDKGQIFYPTNLFEIQPKEFLKAKKLNRKITTSEFEVDPDEWKRLVEENAMVRVLEGGKKIMSKDENFYDQDVITGLTGEWQKGNRAMHNILGKMKIKTGDVFILWRMQKLAEDGRIEIQGDPKKGWKDFEVKLKSATPVETIEITNE